MPSSCLCSDRGNGLVPAPGLRWGQTSVTGAVTRSVVGEHAACGLPEAEGTSVNALSVRAPPPQRPRTAFSDPAS